MNDIIETISVTLVGVDEHGDPKTLTLTKHADGDISFLDFNGIRHSSPTEFADKLFATIKANGSGTTPVIGRVDH